MYLCYHRLYRSSLRSKANVVWLLRCIYWIKYEYIQISVNNTLYTESTSAEPYVYYSSAKDTILYLVVQVYAELVYLIASICGCSCFESLALTTLRRNLTTVTKLLYRSYTCSYDWSMAVGIVLYSCIVIGINSIWSTPQQHITRSHRPIHQLTSSCPRMWAPLPTPGSSSFAPRLISFLKDWMDLRHRPGIFNDQLGFDCL